MKISLTQFGPLMKTSADAYYSNPSKKITALEEFKLRTYVPIIPLSSYFRNKNCCCSK